MKISSCHVNSSECETLLVATKMFQTIQHGYTIYVILVHNLGALLNINENCSF